ncbi:MAG: histidine kinase [Ferruginibacter sp.]
MQKFILPDNVIFKIKEDQLGRIWFFSQTGKLSFYNNGKIYPYKFNSNIEAQIKSISITNAFIIGNDDILLNSYNRYNYDIDKKGKISAFNYDNIKKDSLIFSISSYDNKRLFVRKTLNGKRYDTAYIYDLRYKNEVYKIPFNQLSSGYYGIAQNQKNELYFFNSKYLIKLLGHGKYLSKEFPGDILSVKCINENTNIVGLIKEGAYSVDSQLKNLKKIAFLEGKSVTCIEQDFERGIWFSTLENGMFYSPETVVENISPGSNDPILRISVLNDSTFIGASKDGVYEYKNQELKQIFKKNYQAVKDIFVDKNKNIIIGAAYDDIYPANCIGKIIKIPKGDFNKIISIHSSSEIGRLGNFNLVFSQEKQYLFTTIPQQIEKSTYLPIKKDIEFLPGKIYVTSDSSAYIGTISGLYKIDKIDTIPKSIHKDVFNSGIICIRELSKGVLAIGLRFGGIVILKDDKIISSITEDDGLINNSIKYLLPIQSNLWVATANGISVISFKGFDFKNYSISNFGKSKGLSDLIIYQLAAFKNDILATTNNGILQIKNRDSLVKITPEILPLYISMVNFAKKDTTDLKDINVPFSNNKIIFYFTALSFAASDDIKYYYRFIISDSTWTETKGSELILENLSPGKYLLQLKATIQSEKRYSKIFSVNINIEKPWYQNNWLRLLVIIALITIIFIAFRWRIQKIRIKDFEKNNIKVRMAELEQTALRSQMNPHFIFNCLTSIQQLIVLQKNDEANDYLVQFSKLIRDTLENSSKSFLSIRNTIEYLSRYLLLEQMRFPGQFDFDFKIGKEVNIDKELIPTMIIQPLIENSIRHGFKGLVNKKGSINISFEEKEGFIICTIIDNGIGNIKGDFLTMERHGLKNISQRLAMLNNSVNKQSVFEINNIYNEKEKIIGTKALLKISYL